MAIRRDLTGLSYGWLEVLRYDHTDDKRHTWWLCRCKCGAEKLVRDDGLRGGTTVSCGCRRSNSDVKSAQAMRLPKATRTRIAKAGAKARWEKKETTDGRDNV